MNRARILAVVPALVAVLLPTTAGAKGPVGCAGRFPETTFVEERTEGPLRLLGAGIGDALMDRYATEFGGLAGMLEADLGSVGGIEVCIFPNAVPWDAQALGWPEFHRLHAAAFGSEGVVVVSAYLITPSIDAGRNGLVHVWLWRLGEGLYPQVLAEDVKGLYRNRLDSTVDSVHNALVRQNIGLAEPWPPFNWMAGAMTDPLLFDPEKPYGGMGDFAGFVMDAGDATILADPEPAAVADLDEQWRQALYDESGSTLGGSKEWIVGAVMIFGLLLLAAALAYLTRRARLRAHQQRRAAALRMLSGQSAVGRSGSPGAGRPDAGVGSGPPGAVGRHGDDRDRPPARSQSGAGLDGVPSGAQAGDDLFRHPEFTGED